MILIGFVWVILSTLLSVAIKAVLPGRWEDHGPTVMVVAAAGASITSMTGLLLVDGINSYDPAPSPAAAFGVGLSILGGLGAVGAYVVDARRRQKA